MKDVKDLEGFCMQEHPSQCVLQLINNFRNRLSAVIIYYSVKIENKV